jgi:hypothetical protein
MTEPFSPAAQAVLDAYGDFEAADVDAMAAALRAAAEQIEDLYCDSDMEDSPGVVFAMRQLMLIAAELGGSGDT